jgi:putative SOS response-associated peptidase YedK
LKEYHTDAREPTRHTATQRNREGHSHSDQREDRKGVDGRYFRHIWRQDRVNVPADGSYMWTGAHRQKQPWYIRLKTDRPMFLAAISNFVLFKEGPPGSGFVIVTR